MKQLQEGTLALAEPGSVAGKKVTVIGLGHFGGGIGAVQFLVRHGANVTVTDLRSESELADAIRSLESTPPDRLHLGGHRNEDIETADLLVVSPAVPKESPFLQLAVQSGIPVTSEMNLFWQFNPAPIVGVTGSNGKSTTTAMIHSMMEATGRRCWLGGNIGRSLLPVVEEIKAEDLVVLELSSFQLEDLDRLQRSPHCSLVTNFSPNHLDRHQTLDNYRHAKQAILRWQSASDVAILNQEDPDVLEWPCPAERLFFGTNDKGRPGMFLVQDRAIFRWRNSEQMLDVPRWLTLPGQHNLQNALGAACAARAMQATIASIQTGLSGFKALPHRLELVGDGKGRRFYNDSLATTPESTMVALEAFSDPVILFAGGYDKGSDLNQMARAIAQKQTKAVALMGTTGPRLAELISQFDINHAIRLKVCHNFQEAFQWAVQCSSPGDVLLLSPGCASYDWFRNFVDRGNQFRNLSCEWLKLD